MKTTRVIPAVTETRRGVGIAGVRQDAPSVWVRPMRGFGTVMLGDIAYPSQAGERRVMRPFDLTEITFDEVSNHTSSKTGSATFRATIDDGWERWQRTIGLLCCRQRQLRQRASGLAMIARRLRG
jgi:hypothetical protein